MGTEEEIFSLFTVVYSFALVIIVNMALIESRYCRWIYWMSSLGYIVLCCFIFLVLYQLYNMEMIRKYIFIVNIVPASVYFFIMAKYHGSRFFFTYFTAEMICMAAISLSMIMSMPFNGGTLKHLITIMVSVTLCIFCILMFLAKPYRCIMAVVKKNCYISVAIPLLFCALLYGYFFYPAPIVLRPQSIPNGIIILALIVVVYRLLYEVVLHLNKAESDVQGLRLQISFQKEQYSMVWDKVQSAQIFHHDLRHHANLLAKMILDKNYEEAFAYTQKLGSYVFKSASTHYCENSLVNAILSVHLEAAKMKNITLNCRAVLPKNIDIDEMELCVMLSNLLENAVVHCGSSEENKRVLLDISILQKKEQLCIRIQNSCSRELEQKQKKTPVLEERQNGIGLQSVGAIVERKRGVMDITCTENTFTVYVGLKI